MSLELFKVYADRPANPIVLKLDKENPITGVVTANDLTAATSLVLNIVDKHIKDLHLVLLNTVAVY